MSIWVVGAHGLIGSYLSSFPCVSVATTRLEANLLDVKSLEAILQKHPSIDWIINAAAYTSVDLAEKEKELSYEINAIGSGNLAKLAFSYGKGLLHLSTDYVFSETKQEEIREEAPFSFCNHYGFTKAEGEKKVKAFHPFATILRTSWIFGGNGSNFASKIQDLLMQKEELFLRDDQFSKLSYLPDLAEAIFQLIEKEKRGEIYHFANLGVTTRYRFALAMQKKLQENKVLVKTKRIHPTFCDVSEGAKRPLYSALNTEKIEKVIGPIASWEERLETLSVFS